MTGPFNLRVYAIFIEEESILLSTETSEKISFTKFPGGGIDYGEGITDALKREISEELKIEITGHRLYYVNEFYQPSAFHSQQQIVSFYYLVEFPTRPELTAFTETRWNESFKVEFYLRKLNEVHPEDLTFPIDKVVLEKLKQDYLNK